MQHDPTVIAFSEALYQSFLGHLQPCDLYRQSTLDDDAHHPVCRRLQDVQRVADDYPVFVAVPLRGHFGAQ